MGRDQVITPPSARMVKATHKALERFPIGWTHPLEVTPPTAADAGS